MKKTRILVVDDEKLVCDIIRKLLVAKGYNVFCVTTAEEAIKAVARHRPHLVFLDIRLGNASGLEVLPKLKEMDKKLKIIMLTGVEDTETIRIAKSQGADAFIAKPFDVEFLDRIIAQTLTLFNTRKR